MSRYRLLPTPAQEAVLRDHCAQARFIWNIAVEQHKHWHPGRKSAPGYLEQCGLLARRLADKAPGRVEKVPAAYTSQICSGCGHRDPESRESQSRFRCRACGLQVHADVDAARNIAAGRAVNARGRRRGSPAREPRTSVACLLIRKLAAGISRLRRERTSTTPPTVQTAERRCDGTRSQGSRPSRRISNFTGPNGPGFPSG
jgi:hypothetical protein